MRSPSSEENASHDARRVAVNRWMYARQAAFARRHCLHCSRQGAHSHMITGWKSRSRESISNRSSPCARSLLPCSFGRPKSCKQGFFALLLRDLWYSHSPPPIPALSALCHRSLLPFHPFHRVPSSASRKYTRSHPGVKIRTANTHVSYQRLSCSTAARGHTVYYKIMKRAAKSEGRKSRRAC